jgi:predicted dehydrogenase
MKPCRLAVIGAGTIGKTHILNALQCPDIEIVGVAESHGPAVDWVKAHGLPCVDRHTELLERFKPQGVVIATPNDLHASMALDVLQAGSAALVEKPIADSLESARAIERAARQTGRPVLVGHQRRHNPIMQQAKALVEAGRLGRPVCVTGMATWYKDEAYFEPAWRRTQVGGPVLINLIHDVDLMRFLFGDIITVQAMTSNATRGFEVEDTAVMTFRFANGALGTFTLSDTAVAPWNYDLAAQETVRFAQQEVGALYFSGTHGSLALPRLDFWHYEGERHWERPITVTRTLPMAQSPYLLQLLNFVAVIRGEASPVCSAQDGLRALEIAWAVRESAQSGRPVSLENP